MSNQLGPIEICCDAPPHSIVQACESLGFQSPMDVRWCQLGHFLTRQGEPQGHVGLPFWNWFVPRSEPKKNACSCGEPLPILEWYTFTFVSGQLLFFRLGQCQRCRTIFWEKG
jgi:hypothetical protein